MDILVAMPNVSRSELAELIGDGTFVRDARDSYMSVTQPPSGDGLIIDVFPAQTGYPITLDRIVRVPDVPGGFIGIYKDLPTGFRYYVARIDESGSLIPYEVTDSIIHDDREVLLFRVRAVLTGFGLWGEDRQPYRPAKGGKQEVEKFIAQKAEENRAERLSYCRRTFSECPRSNTVCIEESDGNIIANSIDGKFWYDTTTGYGVQSRGECPLQEMMQ